MNPLPITNTAELASRFVLAGFSSTPIAHLRYTGYKLKQRGVVLFLTLIALLAMSLAAVALIRSVDTNALITGNIAFKQDATTSADGGIAAAMGLLNSVGNTPANLLIQLDQDLPSAHPFNSANIALLPGYHSSIVYTATQLKTTTAPWTFPNASPAFNDQAGNSISYIIERMCRAPGMDLAHTDCLYNQAATDNSCWNVPGVCNPPPPGTPAQMRITVRSVGQNGAISYVQGYIF